MNISKPDDTMGTPIEQDGLERLDSEYSDNFGASDSEDPFLGDLVMLYATRVLVTAALITGAGLLVYQEKCRRQRTSSLDLGMTDDFYGPFERAVHQGIQMLDALVAQYEQEASGGDAQALNRSCDSLGLTYLQDLCKHVSMMDFHGAEPSETVYGYGLLLVQGIESDRDVLDAEGLVALAYTCIL
ncbi:hypothetical protein GQ53DRAFT_819006 [Thozetella sp. PMI_491]|nr:hypothetical protein GQ53DRAFT_819006 [Thozetella sp. PMI_491]